MQPRSTKYCDGVLQRRIYTPAVKIDFDAIRAELEIPAEYPSAAVTDAQESADAGPWIQPDRPDRTDLPLITLDPTGSMDLDQAVLIQQLEDGFRVFYAIADVAAFVRPGGPLEAESFVRGQTLYSPDRSTPLHPVNLSESGASLLPGQRRAAILWTIDLDAGGVAGAVDVARVWVRSVARLDYPGAQRDMEAACLHPSITLLPAVGELRQRLSRERHAITLDLPDTEIVKSESGHWTLEMRAIRTIEQYNAEISLLTGMCAADIMIRGEFGILRTLPNPDSQQVNGLRRSIKALGIPWPQGTPPGEIIGELNSENPKEAAFLDHAVRLLRGAGYTAFDGHPPTTTEHAGVGAAYAHVTAPLRRLVDRFGTEICLSLVAGAPVPEWVRVRLEELPSVMAGSDRRANALEKACVGAVGTFLLHDRVGEFFTATVLQIDEDKNRASVLLLDPPVRARCSADYLAEGEVIKVELVSAEVKTNTYLVQPVR